MPRFYGKIKRIFFATSTQQICRNIDVRTRTRPREFRGTLSFGNTLIIVAAREKFRYEISMLGKLFLKSNALLLLKLLLLPLKVIRFI